MKETIGLIIHMFVKSLKVANLGLAVTKDGDLIFNDRGTGQQMIIKRDDFQNAYESMVI